MQRLIQVFVLLLSICLLASCASRQDFSYSPPEGKQALKCIAQCKVAANSCMQICAMKNSTCRSEMQAAATERYTHYKSQRNAQGLPVNKGFDDFIRTTGCTHSCNCVPAYNTCYSACGGHVY